MSILIEGMNKPKNCTLCKLMQNSGSWFYCPVQSKEANLKATLLIELYKNCPLIEIPDKHGRLIDADALRQTMYHEAFETDSPMQKWDSGCWIRYKMFENMEENAPTIISAEKG